MVFPGTALRSISLIFGSLEVAMLREIDKPNKDANAEASDAILSRLYILPINMDHNASKQALWY